MIEYGIWNVLNWVLNKKILIKMFHIGIWIDQDRQIINSERDDQEWKKSKRIKSAAIALKWFSWQEA